MSELSCSLLNDKDKTLLIIVQIVLVQQVEIILITIPLINSTTMKH